MPSQFDVIIPRRGSGSYKWDSSDDPRSLPMWVADMDFRTAPAIIAALSDRVAHGVFGYTKVPDTYYEALDAWFTSRHGFSIKRDWVIYTSGVVPAISAVLKALTRPGERVLIQTPVYNCFFSSIANMGCTPLENVLIAGDDGRFVIDFEDLEAKAAEPDVHVMLLCNPHNPVGRSWSVEELSCIGDICLRHGVTVVSDEIHCDLTFPGHVHHPFATIKPEFLSASVTCTSPSKAFNIAGLQIANIVVTDEELRNRIDKAINIHEVCDVNPFGVTALIAAYCEGGGWLDELRGYLLANYQTVSDFIASNMPTLRLTRQEATYLAWIDCRALSLSSDAIEAQLATDGHLLVNSGTLYGAAGEGFIRLNMACPRAQLLDGLERMQTVLTR